MSFATGRKLAIHEAAQLALAATAHGVPVGSRGGPVDAVQADPVPIASERGCAHARSTHAADLGTLPRIGAMTRREKEILALLGQRLSDAEIADRLYIGVRTVEFHVSNILGKLGVENRREAAALASHIQLG